jgi:hypothetical protein
MRIMYLKELASEHQTSYLNWDNGIYSTSRDEGISLNGSFLRQKSNSRRRCFMISSYLDVISKNWLPVHNQQVVLFFTQLYV